MLTPEQFELLRKLTGSQVQDPGMPQLPPIIPYNERADDYTKQAAELEAQAAQPYPQPQTGKDLLVQSLRAAMENFGRYGAPGGYYGQEAQRQENFRANQQSTLDRVKSLRNQAIQERQAGDLAQNRADTLDETRRVRTVQEREQQLREDQAKRPTRQEISPGATEVVRDPQGNMIGSPYTAPAKLNTELDHRDEVRGSDNHTLRHYFAKGVPDKIVYTADLGETKRDPNLGSTAFTPIYDPQNSTYQGSFSPGLGQFVPAPTQIQGMTNRPNAPAVGTQVSEMENAFRNVEALGGAAQKVSSLIGPYAGWWEESKINGIGKFLPFTESAPGFADFSQLSANIKNHMIKLITGAAVRQDEEPRIISEIPTGQERDYATWLAKYQRTMQNAQYLMSRYKQLNALGPRSQQPNAPAAPSGTGLKPGGAVESLLKGAR